MPQQIAATKGNLIKTKHSLALAENGYHLMDRKRNILINEMMTMADKVKLLRDQITDAYAEGYLLLQKANVYSGVINSIAKEIPADEGIQITYRSVMGVEVPNVIYKKESNVQIPYGLDDTNSKIDEAYLQFQKVKDLTIILAEVDNSVYKLAVNISKTQKRANALKNIVIPRYEAQIKFISDSLDEKDREEFSRMKIIKSQKEADKKKEEMMKRKEVSTQS